MSHLRKPLDWNHAVRTACSHTVTKLSLLSAFPKTSHRPPQSPSAPPPPQPCSFLLVDHNLACPGLSVYCYFTHIFPWAILSAPHPFLPWNIWVLYQYFNQNHSRYTLNVSPEPWILVQLNLNFFLVICGYLKLFTLQLYCFVFVSKTVFIYVSDIKSIGGCCSLGTGHWGGSFTQCPHTVRITLQNLPVILVSNEHCKVTVKTKESWIRLEPCLLEVVKNGLHGPSKSLRLDPEFGPRNYNNKDLDYIFFF